MSQKGLAPILIIIIIAALVGGYLVYQRGTSEHFKIQRDLSLQLNPDNIDGFQVDVRKIISNFAIGGAGVSPQGFAWIAVKENGQWKKIWTGVNNPSCSVVNTYKIPKEIYENCSTNY